MGANAALYLPTEPPRLTGLFPPVYPEKRLIGRPSYYRFTIDHELVQLNVMPPEELPGHLHGFESYVRRLGGSPTRERDALELIRRTKLVLGLVTRLEFATSESLWPALLRLADANDAFLFVNDSLVLWTGGVVIGPDDLGERHA